MSIFMPKYFVEGYPVPPTKYTFLESSWPVEIKSDVHFLAGGSILSFQHFEIIYFFVQNSLLNSVKNMVTPTTTLNIMPYLDSS